MYDKNIFDEIKRLKFEDLLWIIFALLSMMNVYKDYNEEAFLETNNDYFKDKSNNILGMTLLITLLIYIYFFNRNYNAYKNANIGEKNFIQ